MFRFLTMSTAFSPKLHFKMTYATVTSIADVISMSRCESCGKIVSWHFTTAWTRARGPVPGRSLGTLSSTSRSLSFLVSGVGSLKLEGGAGGFTSRGGEVFLFGEEYWDSLGAFLRRSLEASGRFSEREMRKRSVGEKD